MKYITTYESPLGIIIMAGTDRALTALDFAGQLYQPNSATTIRERKRRSLKRRRRGLMNISPVKSRKRTYLWNFTAQVSVRKCGPFCRRFLMAKRLRTAP